MAFSDPQSITVNSVAKSLPRTSFAANSGAFTSADGTLKLSVSHQNGKRSRHVIRIDSNKVAADPLVPNTNVRSSMSAYVVIDVPTTGYTVDEAKQIVDALTGFLTATSGTNVTRVLGNEI